jgi:eukaryotic-like serine/threonine-protein kinase
MIGSRYRLADRIGAGGMGEVYRAHDTVLDRQVALKVLPSALAGDPERLARFQREAQATAALNHPNILAIHDFGTDGETLFAVTELLEGETLRDRLARVHFTVKQSVEVAVAVARGLAAAHGKGIIHRDLKPANLFITTEGVVKILDFGIAKLIHTGPAHEAPTLTGLTVAGAIMGTLGYMAPEQLRGAAVDQRADIFAFGCVLYEMLAGRRPFARGTAAETTSAILNEEAQPLDAGDRAIPSAIARVVDCCLAKRPEDRLASARDLALTLEAVLAATARLPAPPAWRPSVRARAIPWGIAALAVLFAVVVSWRQQREGGQTAPTLRRISIYLSPAIVTRGTGSTSVLAVSPDGTNLVYLGQRGGHEQLYLRPLARADALPISGTENATSPFFSPDSQWLGFFADGKLKKVSLAGGPPLTICAATRGSGASWGVDDTIVFAPASDSRLWRVSAAGGAPEAITTLDEAHADRSHGWPEILPAGNVIVFVAAAASGSRIVALRRGSHEPKTLLDGGTQPHFCTTGHLVYTRVEGVFAVPFDPDTLSVTGLPVAIAEPVPQLAVSRDGLLVHGASPAVSTDLDLVWVDRQGNPRSLTEARRAYTTPRLSPEGKRLAVGVRTGRTSSDIWVLDLERDVLSRLTFDESSSSPIWTPDGKRVAFSSRREGELNLFWTPADGSGPEERLTTSRNSQYAHSFSPDGRLLAFDDAKPGDISLLPVGDRSGAVPLLRTPFREWGPRFSPDGRWLAYLSDESMRLELYVRRYPDQGGVWQLSTDGATEPVWSGNGREIFYRAGERMMVVAVKTEPAFSASRPRVLFEARYEPGAPGISNYDVTPDGQRLLMVRGREQETNSTQLTVVMNWSSDVRPGPSAMRRPAGAVE